MDLNQVQTRDLGKIFNWQKKLRLHKKNKQPAEALQSNLRSLIEKSCQKTEEIAKKFIDIEIKSDLPLAEKADEIKQLLVNNQVVIVAGETGCGKTTQLAKICMQAGLGARGMIAHTQPRRVAATSVAKRIADELDSQPGKLIGYSTRFNSKLSEATRVKLMTDGVLLSEVESDNLLSRYEVIIIDEAHERSLNIDFLLGFIRRILPRRKELRVIITSATIDPESFSRSFNHAPIVSVEGRTFPVEVRYQPPQVDQETSTQEPLLDSILDAVEGCVAESPGDILIFADGEGQIKSIIKHLNQKLSHSADNLLLPLYSRLGSSQQQKVFASSNKRKIIVSTNVAETSLTVPGIIFVIDSGTARISRFSHRNKIQQLPIEKISRASADQRKGRCGRIAPGICVRLYSEEDYQQREEFTCAEIQRTNLTSVVLRLKAMKVARVGDFPFIEPPDDRAWKTAFNSLFELGALDKQQQITSLGKMMARLPVDPQLARILVQPELLAVDEMLIICSLLSVREVRERPHDKQQKADLAHQQFHSNNSDILTAIALWRKLESQRDKLSSRAFKSWCSQNYINFLAWLEWRKVYFQLKQSIEELGIKANQSAPHQDEIHKALIPGFITHIFCKTQEASYQGVRGLKVWLHPSSLSFKRKAAWLLSAEMMQTQKLYARMNCPIQPQWIESYAEHLLKYHYQDIHWRKKSGQVMALLSLSLLGLPVVTNRLVNYSRVDPERCSSIFLREGLAADQLGQDFPFIKANREKLVQLTEQEKRQRQNNIRLDNDSLAQLYAEVLPDHICSLMTLKRWLKKDYKQRNQRLSFSLQELTDNQSAGDMDYPSELCVKGFYLNLSYCFEPGSSEDGISVEIPENMVSQFDDRDFDWLVPGYLEDKVLATLKVLPKPIRRDLIPLNQTAHQASRELASIDQNGRRFLDELVKVLQRQTGKHFKASDFALHKLEPSLSMKYKIMGTQGFYRLASLSQSRQSAGQQKQAASTVLGTSQPELSADRDSQFTNWQFDEFNIENQIKVQGVSSRIFQGLNDRGKYVVIEEYASQAMAEDKHCQGIARLLLLTQQSQLNHFFNTWPDKSSLEKLSIRFDGFRGLFDALVMRWAVVLVVDTLSLKRQTSKDFRTVNEFFTRRFREEISAQLVALLPLIKQREKLFSQIGELRSSAYQESVEDLRKQLKHLWSADVLISKQPDLFEDYARYHKGIAARLKRIQANYPKESQALQTWLEWQEWWRELKAASEERGLGTKLTELSWLLEEFRISLFSPGVKVKGSVSAKKMQVLFEALEAQLD